MQKWGKKTTLCMRMPLIPFFLYWWLNRPTTEGLEKIMNTLGIVDALMLTLAVGMIGTFDYNELRAADDRFLSGVDASVPSTWGYQSFYYTSWWMTMTRENEVPAGAVTIPDNYQVTMSSKFLVAIMLATFFYTISLLMLVLLLVLMNMADLDKIPEGENDQDADERLRTDRRRKKAEMELQEWYKYNHYSMAVSVIGFLVATVLFFRGIWFLILIKSPDYKVLLYGEADTSSIYAYPPLLGFIIGGLMGVCGTMGCWGNYAVHALNEYGKPQSVRHVIFFGPGERADPEESDPETNTRPKAIKSGSCKVAPEPETPSLLQKPLAVEGTGGTGGDTAKLAALLTAVAAELQTLGKRLDKIEAQNQTY